ncbi:unnamed protein product, partial [Ectocarpus fasciculatus]
RILPPIKNLRARKGSVLVGRGVHASKVFPLSAAVGVLNTQPTHDDGESNRPRVEILPHLKKIKIINNRHFLRLPAPVLSFRKLSSRPGHSGRYGTSVDYIGNVRRTEDALPSPRPCPPRLLIL